MAKPIIGQDDWGTVLNDHLDTLQASADLDADVAAHVDDTSSALSASLDAKYAPIGEGGDSGGGGTPTHDFIISRLTGTDTYTCTTVATGVVTEFTDVTSPPYSGLLHAIESCAADGVSIFFPPGVYEFVEDPAGEEDHWAPNGIQHLTLEGAGHGTIISNWRDDTQLGYDTNVDSEPFSMTRCNNLTWRNMRVWAGGNIDSNNSSDALDFDGCSGGLLENLLIERSRARGVALDGGDSGASSVGSTVKNCDIRGVPERPNIFRGSTATIVAQEYRYCLTYVDSILGETLPSDWNAIEATGTTENRITLSTGPLYKGTKGVTQRKLYRWSTAQPTWHLLATINDNTTVEYDDSASDASIAANPAPPVAGETLIPAEGIKFLGAQRHTALNNTIIGSGGHGIQIVRKGSAASSHHSSHHKVIGNTIQHAGHGSPLGSTAGIYVGGGSGNIVTGNTIVNVGTVTELGLGIYVQGLDGEITDHNIICENHISDTQDANSPSGGTTTRYGVQVNTTGTGTAIPDNTVIAGNTFYGLLTGNINVLSATNTQQYALANHVHAAGPGGPAPVVPNWTSGLYYGARSVLAHSSISGQALTANQLFASPVYVPQDITVTTIACNVTAAVGTKLRMGLYTINGTGRPDALIAGSETGDIAMSAGLKTATISAALTGGTWVFAVVICDGDASLTGFSGGQPNIMGSVSPATGTKQSALRVAVGSGWTSLPATFPASPSETAITVNTEVAF